MFSKAFFVSRQLKPMRIQRRRSASCPAAPARCMALPCNAAFITGVVLVPGLSPGTSLTERTDNIRRQSIAVLLTKAMRVPSGDHDGTLIVPCPPKT